MQPTMGGEYCITAIPSVYSDLLVLQIIFLYRKDCHLSQAVRTIEHS